MACRCMCITRRMTGEPVVLPQILTENEVLEELNPG